MIVQAAAARADLVPAVTQVTRISLDDLLTGGNRNARAQQALIDLLRSGGSAVARVVQTEAGGVSVLALAESQVRVRLAGVHAPGELLLLRMEDAVADHAPAATVTLSPSARLIQDLKNIQYNQILTKLDPTTPMMPPDATPDALAQALQQTLRKSGLFYESHLAGWVQGRLALADILDEPQARIADLTPTRQQDGAPEKIHPQLEPLVRQQLDTLERQSIVWRGWLWPEQAAQLTITGDAPADEAKAASATRTWRVNLDMDTPNLGPLKVALALSGERLDVRVGCAATAAARLCGAREQLAQALTARALQVQPIQVAAESHHG